MCEHAARCIYLGRLAECRKDIGRTEHLSCCTLTELHCWVEKATDESMYMCVCAEHTHCCSASKQQGIGRQVDGEARART
jgi:hypothetical protein